MNDYPKKIIEYSQKDNNGKEKPVANNVNKTVLSDHVDSKRIIDILRINKD